MARDPNDFYVGNKINSALKFVKEPDYNLWKRKRKTDQGCYNREVISQISRGIQCDTSSSRAMQMARASAVKIELML